VTGAVSRHLQIALGGVVRVSGSDSLLWPFCNGRPYPPNLHAIVEYSHCAVGSVRRMIIANVVAAWIVFRKRRPRVALLATASLIGVVGEGILGGVVVAQELSPWLVVVHLGLAMMILGFLVATAIAAMPASNGVADSRFRRFAMAVAAATYLMLLTGSTVVASAADDSCNSWPLCGSGSPLTSPASTHSRCCTAVRCSSSGCSSSRPFDCTASMGQDRWHGADCLGDDCDSSTGRRRSRVRDRRRRSSTGSTSRWPRWSGRESSRLPSHAAPRRRRGELLRRADREFRVSAVTTAPSTGGAGYGARLPEPASSDRRAADTAVGVMIPRVTAIRAGPVLAVLAGGTLAAAAPRWLLARPRHRRGDEPDAPKAGACRPNPAWHALVIGIAPNVLRSRCCGWSQPARSGTRCAGGIYVFVYTIWLKRTTPQNIVIGARRERSLRWSVGRRRPGAWT
jgi:hypothetical protein